MKKEIVVVDEKRGIMQVTLPDERHYVIPAKDEKTGNPFYTYRPSVTWITNYVPKGIGFYKWLASKGWDEAEAIKAEAAGKGTKIHKAVEILIRGGSVKMEDKFYNPITDQEEELSPEEFYAVMAFANWSDEAKPEFLMEETIVISEKYNYAGTVDCVARIDGDVYILDWKTSQYIWPSMEAQLSAYKVALDEMGRDVSEAKLAVLQLGYQRNKRGWKFNEIEDQFEDLFLTAYKFWDKDNKNKDQKQIEMPIESKLKNPKKKEDKKPKKVVGKKIVKSKKVPKKKVSTKKVTKKDATPKR